MLDNFVSPYDATVVEKLNAAGMVTLGKTNMDEFAMGSSNETSFYGPVKNPVGPEAGARAARSGGSAAAVAARIAPIATATDTGGSIRQPASLCGVTGIKPTYGRVSRYGMIAFASSLDQGGLISQSAEDAAMVLGAMSGFDPRDSTSVDTPVPNYVETLDAPLAGLKIGLIKEFFEQGPRRLASRSSSARRSRSTRSSARSWSRSNYRRCRCPCPPTTWWRRPSVRRTSRASTACATAIARKDPKDLHGPLQALARRGLRRRGQAPHHDGHVCAVRRLLRRVLPEGAARASADQPGLQARVRAKSTCSWAPPRPTSPSASARRPSDPIQMYLNDIYTIGANLAGVPAMSIPCGFVRDLPVGLQICGPHFARGEAAQRGARVPEGNRLASQDSRRVQAGEAVMSASTAGKPSSASRSTRSSRRSRRSSPARPRPTARRRIRRRISSISRIPGVLPVLNRKPCAWR